MEVNVSELEKKQIEHVAVYSDVVLFGFMDGSMADVRVVDGALRIEVRRKGPEGARRSCSVYPGLMRHR